MKKKYLISISLLLLYPLVFAFSESGVERILNKDKQIREEIKRKDEERRARILKKFEDFKKRVEQFAPGMKLKLPVGLDYAQDIGKLDAEAKIKNQKEYYAWTAESYKLRSLPYDSVREFTATVKKGDRVSVLMKPAATKIKQYKTLTKNWFLVKTSDGIEGYIPGNLLLRKKPSAEGGSLGFLNGRPMISVDNPADWQEESNDSGMFVLAQFSTGNDTNVNTLKKMKVSASVLNLRDSPGTTSEVTGKLYSGDVVEVLEYTSYYDYYAGNRGRWAKVRMDSVTGWVFSYYLKEIGSDPVDNKPEYTSYLEKGRTLYVKSDILRVRDAPDDMGIVVFSLENRQKVTITDMESDEITLGGKKSKWVKVKYLDYEGWVFGAFLSTDSSSREEGDDINNLFQVPIEEGKYFISSKFGKRILKGKVSNHTGVDLAAPCGTKVTSAADGNVILVVNNNRNCTSCGYGNYVIVEHKNGFRTVYGHLTSISVSNGQKLNSGDKVGTVGNTGHSYGCHLHFEIRAYEEFVDPLKYIHQ